MKVKDKVRNEMNRLGSIRKPFTFPIDFLMEDPLVIEPHKASDTILWQTPFHFSHKNRTIHSTLTNWDIEPVPFDDYKEGFDTIMHHIHNGDTYLLNYTKPTKVSTNLKLEDIFYMSHAPYKIMLRNKFVCFSPEPFVTIDQGRIHSFPMKGTIDASIKDAADLILSDQKELAEHHTIVDLIRNDLSLVAKDVRVEDFRYLQRIHTNKTDLWQVSSKISGQLPDHYNATIGDLIFTLLPAGSVSGAPKQKTLEIIREAENYNRGYYTGIFGYFDGNNLESCVLIRFIEQTNDNLIFKSGGGITFMSEAATEYDEMIKKVYVPIG